MAQYLVGHSRSKSGTFWIQFSRDTILNCTETSKETFICKGINFGISCILVCVCFYFPVRLWFLWSLTWDQVDPWTKEREVQHRWHFSVKNGIPVFHVHPQSFYSILNFQFVFRCGQRYAIEEHQYAKCKSVKFWLLILLFLVLEKIPETVILVIFCSPSMKGNR